MREYVLPLPFLLVITSYQAFTQIPNHVDYKIIDTVTLSMKIYAPPAFDPSARYPAMVFFFGGGWTGGSTDQFVRHAEYFSKRGIVCFLADYRVKTRHGTSPFEALQDAKSSIRYIRAHAGDFAIDSSKIIAAGGSAGGHLAAACAMIESFNDPTDNLMVSARPSALVLYNPVIDNGPGGYGYERIGAYYKDFSPLHNIMPGAPPAAIFLGTNDQLIPVTTVKYFQSTMEKVGSRCDLHLYEGQAHGFFNYGREPFFSETLATTHTFLHSLGYISGIPSSSN